MPALKAARTAFSLPVLNEPTPSSNAGWRGWAIAADGGRSFAGLGGRRPEHLFKMFICREPDRQRILPQLAHRHILRRAAAALANGAKRAQNAHAHASTDRRHQQSDCMRALRHPQQQWRRGIANFGALVEREKLRHYRGIAENSCSF
jgi:hypothetical protein